MSLPPKGSTLPDRAASELGSQLPKGYQPPRGATAADAEPLGFLASTVFRGEGSPSDAMPSEFPLLYAESNLPNFRIICYESKPVSGVGIHITDALCLGHTFRIGSVGSVCTYSAHRGKGLATMLMFDAESHMRRADVDLVIVSGGRGLYRRINYEPAGLEKHYAVPAEISPPRMTWREAADSDVYVLASIYSRKPVRFRRSLDDFKSTLAAFRFQARAGPGRTVIAKTDGRVVAYLSALVRRRDDTKALETSETGGDPRSVVNLAAALAADEGVKSFDLAVPGAHEDLSIVCGRRGFSEIERPASGTFKLLDPAGFVDKMRPLIAERAGTQFAKSLEVGNLAGGGSFRLNGERLDVSKEAELLRLIFEPGWRTEELDSGQLGALMGAAFPLPMIMPGFNFI